MLKPKLVGEKPVFVWDKLGPIVCEAANWNAVAGEMGFSVVNHDG